ncbi:MAG TPA: hypothetical protein VMR50_00120 [Myxococcota bacterium]|nr:hypothetical protein [Myxococcota bacterium]
MSRDASPSAEKLPAMIEQIYGAAVEGARWAETFRSVLRFAGGTRGVLGLGLPEQPKVETQLTHEIDLILLGRFQEEYGGSDLYYERVGRLPPGTVFRGCDVISRDELESDPRYHSFYGPMGVDDLLTAILTNADGRIGYLSGYRSRRDGPFSAEQIVAFRALSPHLTRAAQIHERLHRSTLFEAATHSVLALLPFGVMTLDGAGRIASLNPAAERIFDARDGLTLQGSRLRSSSPNIQRELERAIGRACARAGAAREGSLLHVQRPSLRRPYLVLIAPLPSEPESLAILGGREVAAFAVFSDPELDASPTEDRLRALFGLTPALGRLAAALVAGKTLSEHAALVGTTEGTVRQQLKELMARTRTRRQAELVAVLLSGIAQLSFTLS